MTERWVDNSKFCPGCRETPTENLGLIDIERYVFGETLISLPSSGIDILGCDRCKLIFKSRLPSPEFLTAVMDEQAGNVWNDIYDFSAERQLIQNFTSLERCDLLDVGPGNGQFLKSCGDGSGRLSGLDMYAHPGLANALRGEFISGLVDQESIVWSGEQYDVVTMFDVLEHVYEPMHVFKNLSEFLKPGGIAVLETGDADCSWAKSPGLPSWWYLCRFEHHVFWNQESIVKCANENGFDVTSIGKVKSKAWKSKSLKFKFVQCAAYAACRLAPAAYKDYCRKNNKPGVMSPAAPFMTDHLLVVLRKRVSSH